MSAFRCSKDTDIESFLQNKAIKFQERGWCSVYLLLNKAYLEQRKIKIEAYFTLSHKILVIDDKVSKNKKKKLCNGLPMVDNHLHFILIGQLGKYIEESSNGGYNFSNISAKEILDRAFEIISLCNKLIACNLVMVECKDIPKVRKVYVDYKFKELQKSDGLIQYIKRI